MTSSSRHLTAFITRIHSTTWLDLWLGFILRKQIVRTKSKLENKGHFYLMALGLGCHKTLDKIFPFYAGPDL